LALAIGGLGYGPWVLASYGLFSYDMVFVLVFMILGSASPTIAALIVSRLQFGKMGPDYIFRQFYIRGAPKPWLLVAAILPLALASSAALLWILAGGEYNYSLSPLKLLEFFPILLSNFVVNVWEEVGWRGYALPTLQRKYSALSSSLIIGIVWAVWHWPHFAVKDNAMAVNFHNFLYFLAFMPLFSVSYTLIYNSSKGNLFAPSLYHASTNAANIVLFAEPGVSNQVFPFYFLVVAALAIVIILAFKPDSLSRKGMVTLDRVMDTKVKNKI
jgi:membrane protease YdiL (CAAX protease family)